MFIGLSPHSLSLCLLDSLSVGLSIYLSYLFIYLSVLSINLSIYLSLPPSHSTIWLRYVHSQVKNRLSPRNCVLAPNVQVGDIAQYFDKNFVRSKSTHTQHKNKQNSVTNRERRPSFTLHLLTQSVFCSL